MFRHILYLLSVSSHEILAFMREGTWSVFVHCYFSSIEDSVGSQQQTFLMDVLLTHSFVEYFYSNVFISVEFLNGHIYKCLR